jgi:hypothetical protein
MKKDDKKTYTCFKNKVYPCDAVFVIEDESTPYWQKLGFKTLDDFYNTSVFIDLKTGKVNELRNNS